MGAAGEIAGGAVLPRLGLILLATDLTLEGDVARLILPDEAAVHATRVAYANPTTPANLRGMGPVSYTHLTLPTM